MLLVSDPRVRKITFTGSRDVGEHICRTAGLKKVTMELGSNSPVIIMPDADMNKVTTALSSTGYAHAGQVCISTQRVYANREIYGDFLDAFAESVKGDHDRRSAPGGRADGADDPRKRCRPGRGMGAGGGDTAGRAWWPAVSGTAR